MGRLDQVEKLQPGSGRLDLGLAASKTGATAYLDYQHRLHRNLSLYSQASASKNWGSKPLELSATAGLRLRF